MIKPIKNRTLMIELVLSYLVINCVNIIFFKNDPGFQNMPVHPYWAIILLISSRYGFLPGFIAGWAAFINYMFFLFDKIPTRTALEILIEDKGIIVPVLFVIVGAVIGGIRGKYKTAEQEREEELKQKEQNIESLNKRLEALDKTVNALESRIAREQTTLRTIYSAARNIENLDLSGIFERSLAILAEELSVDKASLYLKEEEYMVLKSTMGWDEGEAVEGKKELDKSIMRIVFDKNTYVTIKDIIRYEKSNEYINEYGSVLAMFPLKDIEGNVFGIINVEKIDFLMFNKPNIELMNLVADWVGRSISNRITVDMLKEKITTDEELGIYNYSFFEKILNKEFGVAIQFDLPLAVSAVKVEGFAFLDPRTADVIERMTAALLKKAYTDLDFIFKYKYNGTFIVISPVRTKEDAEARLGSMLSEIAELKEKNDQTLGHINLKYGVSANDQNIKDKETLLKNACSGAGIKMSAR